MDHSCHTRKTIFCNEIQVRHNMECMCSILYFTIYLVFFSPHILKWKKIYSFSIVGSSLFYQCIFANYFYFQINGLGCAVSTNISQVLGPGSNLSRAKKIYDFTVTCQKFRLFPWHSG